MWRLPASPFISKEKTVFVVVMVIVVVILPSDLGSNSISMYRDEPGSRRDVWRLKI